MAPAIFCYKTSISRGNGNSDFSVSLVPFSVPRLDEYHDQRVGSIGKLFFGKREDDPWLINFMVSIMTTVLAC